jgi:hypothetical protein
MTMESEPGAVATGSTSEIVRPGTRSLPLPVLTSLLNLVPQTLVFADQVLYAQFVSPAPECFTF